MATMGLYAILDKAADCYGRPLVYATDGLAVRELAEEVSKPDSHFGKHARDFSLYCFGKYDDNGTFELLPEPRFVIAALSLVNGEDK